MSQWPHRRMVGGLMLCLQLAMPVWAQSRNAAAPSEAASGPLYQRLADSLVLAMLGVWSHFRAAPASETTAAAQPEFAMPAPVKTEPVRKQATKPVQAPAESLVDSPEVDDSALEVADSSSMVVEIGRGLATWYGLGLQGRPTASGERLDMNALTAAHRTLPFGTRVKVRNMVNGREVVVRINDRGPHTKGRIIGLSRKAAETLDVLDGDHMVQLLRQ